MTAIITRITDLEHITAGEVVIANRGVDGEESIFWSTMAREHLPYMFGGFATLSRTEKEGKSGIIEKRYGFDIEGFIISRPQEELFFEQGNPRYEQLYDPLLRKVGQ